MQVHDKLCFDPHMRGWPIKREMEAAATLDVPLQVRVAIIGVTLSNGATT